MRKLKLLTITAMTFGVLLTGCGLQMSFKNSSEPIVENTEDIAGSVLSSEKVTSSRKDTQEETSSEDTEVIFDEEEEEVTTTEQVTTESIMQGTGKKEFISIIGDSTIDIDVLETEFEFSVPDEYVLLEDKYTTNTSRMYALSKKGKIVATIFMNYVNTKEYTAEQVFNAYKEEIEEQYNVISTSILNQNGFEWNGFFGYKKEDEDKSGYIVFDTSDGATMYLEFMCADSYECALDVAEVLKTFKRTGGSENNRVEE